MKVEGGSHYIGEVNDGVRTVDSLCNRSCNTKRGSNLV